ncbi:MAG: type IV toxin-antitoxin system AbiEi family antitoxin domain-containing protein [Brevibacterium aurantiacum]
MSYKSIAAISDVAADYNGYITSQMASEVGVNAKQLKLLADSGILARISHGIYKFAAAPDRVADHVFWQWLSVSKGVRLNTEGLRPVIAAGETAADLLGIGDFLPRFTDFIVQRRTFTRLDNVELRQRYVEPQDVTFVDMIPTLTIEATLADLAATGNDPSLIGDACRDARNQHRLVRPDRLIELLDRRSHIDGSARRDGIAFLEWIDPDFFRMAA